MKLLRKIKQMGILAEAQKHIHGGNDDQWLLRITQQFKTFDSVQLGKRMWQSFFQIKWTQLIH